MPTLVRPCMASPLLISTSARKVGFLTQKASLLKQSSSVLKLTVAFFTVVQGLVLLALPSMRT